MNWKTIAIIFIVLFTIETGYIIWAITYVTIEDNKELECLYNICGEYPEAIYQEDICYCYDYDLLGDYTVVKTEVLR